MTTTAPRGGEDSGACANGFDKMAAEATYYGPRAQKTDAQRSTETRKEQPGGRSSSSCLRKSPAGRSQGRSRTWRRSGAAAHREAQYRGSFVQILDAPEPQFGDQLVASLTSTCRFPSRPSMCPRSRIQRRPPVVVAYVVCAGCPWSTRWLNSW